MNDPDDVKCVSVVLAKIKGPVPTLPEADAGCSYRETQAPSPLDKGAAFYPMPYLK